MNQLYLLPVRNMRNKLFVNLGLVIIAATLIMASCKKGGDKGAGKPPTTIPEVKPAPSDAARELLKSYILNVKTSDGHIYDAKDDKGHNMDCLKIIANPAVPGEYIGVSHMMVDGKFTAYLATSTDLLHWKWIRQLAGSESGPASQPTIKATPDGGFVLAWEQEPKNFIRLVYHKSWDDVKNGVITKTFDAPHTLSTCAEGTPNLYAADKDNVSVGFHYWSNCDVDRQAKATCNWSTWESNTESDYDKALLVYGPKGNIGDRDGYMTIDGFNFGIIEAQGQKNDFGTWKSYIYDYQTKKADLLNIVTHGGSQSFANPTFTKTEHWRPKRYCGNHICTLAKLSSGRSRRADLL
jgi:hypothetical protein